MQQKTRRQPTDLSVEVKPVAVTCVREAVRHAEKTSCAFLVAAACAIPTLRAARACMRASCPSWQRSADNRQRGDLPLQHATNRTCQSHRAGRSDHARVGTSAHPKANRTHATRANRGNVKQATCGRHHAGRQRAAKNEQRKPSSSSSHAERAPDTPNGTECTDASGQRATHDMQWTTRGGRHCSGRAVAKRRCSRRHCRSQQQCTRQANTN